MAKLRSPARAERRQGTAAAAERRSEIVAGFATAIACRQKSLGLSTTNLAELAGTHQTTVSRIEKETRAPSLLLSAKLAPGLGVGLDVLLREAARLAPATDEATEGTA